MARTLCEFIHLRGVVLAQYKIIYHINDGFDVNKLVDVKSKHLLFFQRFSNVMQQTNLILVDSSFPVYLADLTSELFFHRVATFQQYTQLKKDFVVISKKFDATFFKHKFYEFIRLLLYTNLATSQVFNHQLQTQKIYVLNNAEHEAMHYTYYQQRELQQLLFEQAELSVNMEPSTKTKSRVVLGLEIRAPRGT